VTWEAPFAEDNDKANKLFLRRSAKARGGFYFLAAIRIMRGRRGGGIFCRRNPGPSAMTTDGKTIQAVPYREAV
jgi:hypothetical protein